MKNQINSESMSPTAFTNRAAVVGRQLYGIRVNNHYA